MKYYLQIFVLIFGTAIFPKIAFALDPSKFLVVLNVNVHDSGCLIQAQELLGKTKQIDQGDAAEYEGRVEYILGNSSEVIKFMNAECMNGYQVRRANSDNRAGKTVMKPKVKTIMAGGLRLGMNKMEMKKLFAGDIVGGGWALEKVEKQSRTQSYTYKKTIEVKDDEGRMQKYCDRIWITLIQDKKEKLVEYTVKTGGCDDSPC